MKNIKNNIKIVILASMLAIGSGYAYAWTGPLSAPPDNNVSAPINVGDSAQVKSGGFGAANITAAGLLKSVALQITGDIKFSKGAGAGKVLTSDAVGNATWQNPGTNPTNPVGTTTPVTDCTTDPTNPDCTGTPHESQGDEKILFGKEIEVFDYCPLYGYAGSFVACTAPAYVFGQITAGRDGVPADAKEVLLAGTIDSSAGHSLEIQFAQPTKTNNSTTPYDGSGWHSFISSYQNAVYPNSNSVWVPLDSDGHLLFRAHSIKLTSYDGGVIHPSELIITEVDNKIGGMEQYKLYIQGYSRPKFSNVAPDYREGSYQYATFTRGGTKDGDGGFQWFVQKDIIARGNGTRLAQNVYYDAKTAKKVCQVMGYDSGVARRISDWEDSGDDVAAYWNGTKWVQVQGAVGGYMEEVLCRK